LNRHLVLGDMVRLWVWRHHEYGAIHVIGKTVL
jgi:hypothetical protein